MQCLKKFGLMVAVDTFEYGSNGYKTLVELV